MVFAYYDYYFDFKFVRKEMLYDADWFVWVLLFYARVLCVCALCVCVCMYDLVSCTFLLFS